MLGQSKAVNRVKDIDQIKGVVEFYRRSNGEKDFKFEAKHNLVVSNARKILRDLVFGKANKGTEDVPDMVAAPSIEYLVLGDMNLEIEQASQSVPEATITDVKLVNPTVWVPCVDEENYPNNKVEAVEYKGLNTIKYTFMLAREQGNTAKGFFCELGLAVNRTDFPDAYLFTKLNRKALPKTSNDELMFVYYLMF